MPSNRPGPGEERRGAQAGAPQGPNADPAPPKMPFDRLPAGAQYNAVDLPNRLRVLPDGLARNPRDLGTRSAGKGYLHQRAQDALQ